LLKRLQQHFAWQKLGATPGALGGGIWTQTVEVVVASRLRLNPNNFSSSTENPNFWTSDSVDYPCLLLKFSVHPPVLPW